MKYALLMYYRELLVWARIPQLYQRVFGRYGWWAMHSDLHEHLKALRVFMLGRVITVRNNVFGTAMLVATRQIQTRAELRDMSATQIMRAYRDGRLDYMMAQPTEGLTGWGDKMFTEWARNGGRIRPVGDGRWGRRT